MINQIGLTIKHAISVLLGSAHQSFHNSSFQHQSGTFAHSYQKHKQYKSSLRYYCISSFMLLLATVFIITIVFQTLFPFSNIKQAQAATYGVTNLSNDPAVVNSLPWAIDQANTNPGPDTIDISVSGVMTIDPVNYLELLPGLSGEGNGTTIQTIGGADFTIDGSSLAGSSSVIYVTADDCVIDGLKIKNSPLGNGVAFQIPGNNITIRNCVVSNNARSGLAFSASGTYIVENNYIGTDDTGELPDGNIRHGISSESGILLATNNVVSGNSFSGINIPGRSISGSQIIGNYIGTNKTGDNMIGNAWSGIQNSEQDVLIDGNIIGGNGTGLNNTGSNATIQNNFIGVGANPAVAVPNTSGVGLYTRGGTTFQNNTVGNNIGAGMQIGATWAGRWMWTGNVTVQNNYIGVTAAGLDVGNGGNGMIINGTENSFILNNIISSNGDNGIEVMEFVNTIEIDDNYIGTDPTGELDYGNGSRGIHVSGGNISDIDFTDNIISGNDGIGLNIQAGSSHQILSNYIGLNQAGDSPIPNDSSGIRLHGSNNTLAQNVVSANGGAGIVVQGTLIEVISNLVGTDKDGNGLNSALGNGDYGIVNNNGAHDNEYINNVMVNSSEEGFLQGNYITGPLVLTQNTYISDNSIGVDSFGNACPNANGMGIRDVDDFTIKNNIISGNSFVGIGIENAPGSPLTNANINIYGNLIGTNLVGDTVPNLYGVYFTNPCTSCQVGLTGVPNIISGNTQNGINIFNVPSLGITNNYIGIASDFSSPLPNGEIGIAVGGDSDNTTISRNDIANNNNGVMVGYDDPIFGLGTPSKYVTISENSIYNNTTQGISLENGANEDVQAPEIKTIEYNPGPDNYDVTVSTVYLVANVELFTDSDDQGETYEGNAPTAPDANFYGISKATGTNFTATVTNANGSTSMFSSRDSTPPVTNATPAGGNYNIALTVTLESTDNEDPNPVIYYTTDGTDPNTSSPSCTKSCDIDITHTTDLKFFATDVLGNVESIKTESYTISSSPSGKKLKISNVNVSDIGSTHATVNWDTNKNSNSVVYYGKTASLNKTKSNSANVIDHEIELTSLEPNTTYYYQVESNTSSETAKSAVGTFTTFKKEIDPPEITVPTEGEHFFTLYMTHNEKPIEVKLKNPKLKEGTNRVYVDDKKQKNKKTGKKNAKIKKDGTAEFDIEVNNNNVVARNDGHKIEADAINKNGNTSQKSEPVSFAMGSTHSSGTISFAPTVAERPADMVNTTLVSQPTIASYFPGVAGAEVYVYRKNINDRAYVLDGTVKVDQTSPEENPTAAAVPSIMNFSYKFFLPQPPGKIDLYFDVKNSQGELKYTSEPFSLVYYKGCPATWQGTTVDSQTTSDKPWLQFLMCHTQEYEIFLDGAFNGSGTAPATATGTASIAYLPFLPLSEGEHSVKIRTFESYGYPYSDTSATFNIESTGYGGGTTPTPSPEPSPEPEAVITEEIIIEDGGEVVIEEKIEYIQKKKKLTKLEKALLKQALEDSLKSASVTVTINGYEYLGQIIDGIRKFCIKKCVYPSITDQDMIDISGKINLTTELEKKLAGTDINTELQLGDRVEIAKVNKTGEWSMSVPVSDLPDSDIDGKMTASAGDINSDEVIVAKFKAQTEPAISNTSILIFINLGLAVIILLIGGIIYIRRREY